MEFLKIGLCAVFAVLLVALVIDWSARLDSKRAMASQKYEKCMTEVYKMTPMGYYEVNGSFPDCDYDQLTKIK